jgi:hypothetical protein
MIRSWHRVGRHLARDPGDLQLARGGADGRQPAEPKWLLSCRVKPVFSCESAVERGRRRRQCTAARGGWQGWRGGTELSRRDTPCPAHLTHVRNTCKTRISEDAETWGSTQLRQYVGPLIRPSSAIQRTLRGVRRKAKFARIRGRTSVRRDLGGVCAGGLGGADRRASYAVRRRPRNVIAARTPAAPEAGDHGDTAGAPQAPHALANRGVRALATGGPGVWITPAPACPMAKPPLATITTRPKLSRSLRALSIPPTHHTTPSPTPPRRAGGRPPLTPPSPGGSARRLSHQFDQGGPPPRLPDRAARSPPGARAAGSRCSCPRTKRTPRATASALTSGTSRPSRSSAG